MNQLRGFKEGSELQPAPSLQSNATESTTKHGTSTLEKHEARIRKDVTQDIQNLLSSTKAYVRHHSKNVVNDPQHTKALAAPREVHMHPENTLARKMEDPVLWAKFRAFQLEEEREAKEAAAAKEAKRRAEQERVLRAHQEERRQRSVRLEEESNAAAKQEAMYKAQVAKYVRNKAAEELRQKQAARQAELKQGEELAHSQK